MGFIGYVKTLIIMSKKTYIKDKHVSYVPSLTKEKRASFSVFIELTLLNKFLLLKYKWS